MADDDRGREKPSLELPSWGLRRKRRKEQAEEAPPATDAAETRAQPVTPPFGERGLAETAPAPRAPADDEAPTAVTPPPVVAGPDVQTEPLRPLYADQGEPMAPTTPAAAPTDDVEPLRTAEEPTTEDRASAATAPERASRRERRARRQRPGRTRTRVGGMPSAILTGLLVGTATVGLTWGSEHACELTRGTSSCGGGPGFLLLLAILVAMTATGALLLRLLGVPDPTSTSVLAVGLLAVLVLLFLVDVLFDWWMVIAIPAFAVLTFALSHWVTTAFVEPGDR